MGYASVLLKQHSRGLEHLIQGRCTRLRAKLFSLGTSDFGIDRGKNTFKRFKCARVPGKVEPCTKKSKIGLMVCT